MENNYDTVSRPKHYNSGKIEFMNWLELGLSDEEYRGYLKGNIYKYITRYGLKNGIEDLKKAQQYSRWLQEFEVGVRTTASRSGEHDREKIKKC